MATSGNWFGFYNGDWLGPLESDPGALAAALSGAGSITAYLTGAPAAALSGAGTVTAYLTAAPVGPAGKSHTNLYLRQILTEYYEAAFNKPRVEPAVAPAAPSPAPAAVRKPEPTPARPSVQIEALISAAEQSLANKPIDAVSALVAEALKFNTLVADFTAFERRVQSRRAREEEELLLLASTIL